MRYKPCQARVPDHTDMVDCGDPVLRADRCARHIRLETKQLREEIKKLRGEITKRRTRIREMAGEPRVPTSPSSSPRRVAS